MPDNDSRSVDEALTSRRSIRAFLPKPVPRADIEAILAAAARAPRVPTRSRGGCTC